MTARTSKVLIVDDDARMRGFVRNLLDAPGRHFLEAADGGEAVELHRKQKPDLILMDIEMPGMDGIQATRAILEQDPRARVIVVTHYTESIWREEAVKAGACGVLLKDDLSELDAMVTQAAYDQARLNPPKQ